MVAITSNPSTTSRATQRRRRGRSSRRSPPGAAIGGLGASGTIGDSVVIGGRRLKSRQEARRVEVSEVAEAGDRRGWAWLRSAGTLALVLTGLGIAAAAVIGVLGLAVAALVDQALG
jgi:hypothetical protein